MCELLGMSANVPTDICFSFTGLVQRGGNTGPHRDGWGIVFYEGKGFRTFKEPDPSVDSKLAKIVQTYPIKSCSVISHIRQANFGDVSLVNTHPFTRELWGEYWTFAHNGQLKNSDKLNTGFFSPVGETDSEKAFCWLLHQLIQKFSTKPKNINQLFTFISSCCDNLRELGIFNMLLSNGEYVIAYCSTKLCYITRRAPFGRATLIDENTTIDFQAETTPNDIVTVIATEPLTQDETWQTVPEGQCVAFCLGELIYST